VQFNQIFNKNTDINDFTFYNEEPYILGAMYGLPPIPRHKCTVYFKVKSMEVPENIIQKSLIFSKTKETTFLSMMDFVLEKTFIAVF